MSDIAVTDDHPLPPLADSSFPLNGPQVGMVCVMCCEAVMFATLLIAYMMFLGKSMVGPYPDEVLSLPLAILNTVFLVSSSFTIAIANRAFEKQGENESDDDGQGRHGFRFWMTITMMLGILFLVGTAYEWWGMIFHDGLTMNRNLFGTTYFTLIGCHGLHVLVGSCLMGLFVYMSRKQLLAPKSPAPQLLEWYWHLVDGVWIVILLLVYIYGR